MLSLLQITPERRKRLSVLYLAKFVEDWVDPPPVLHPCYVRELYTEYKVLLVLRGLASSVKFCASLDSFEDRMRGPAASYVFTDLQSRGRSQSRESGVVAPCASRRALSRQPARCAGHGRGRMDHQADGEGRRRGRYPKMRSRSPRWPGPATICGSTFAWRPTDILPPARAQRHLHPGHHQGDEIGCRGFGVAHEAMIEHFLCYSLKR